MENVDITVIGAGVIGLAIAAELSRHYESVIVLERHAAFGQETSSRNSEVIHSGIYYQPGSRKARTCVDGAARLYDLCREHNIACRRTGKLIVAGAPEEIPHLEALFRNGRENGLSDLRLLEPKEINALEPRVKGLVAIFLPGTGIIDSHALMKYFFYRAREAGAFFSFNTEAVGVAFRKSGYLVETSDSDFTFNSRVVINSAGLNSDRIAGLAGIDCAAAGYRLRYCKGSYFAYQGVSPVTRLVYPLPQEKLDGLGIHATVDLGGRLRFGPDQEPVAALDYSVDPAKRDVFYQGASKLIDGLERDNFGPDMSGIRPQLDKDGFRDFIITDESGRGLPGLINLIGMESPGLTAAPAIAREVQALVRNILPDKA